MLHSAATFSRPPNHPTRRVRCGVRCEHVQPSLFFSRDALLSSQNLLRSTSTNSPHNRQIISEKSPLLLESGRFSIFANLSRRCKCSSRNGRFQKFKKNPGLQTERSRQCLLSLLKQRDHSSHVILGPMLLSLRAVGLCNLRAGMRNINVPRVARLGANYNAYHNNRTLCFVLTLLS